MGELNIHENWLSTRRLIPRWSVGVSGLLNLIVILLATAVIWWVFFSIEGIYKLYTPLLGFALMIWMLLILLWQIDTFDFWPLSRGFLTRSSPLLKGGFLTALTILLLVLILFGLLFSVIGRYGITYFNWNSLTKFGELGQDPNTARETTSWAFIALSVPFFWLTLLWIVGVGNDLWLELHQPKLGLANWLVITVVSIPLFFIFYHPHLGSMFYPAQVYTAVPPWWKDIAQTNSAEFNMGWMFCIVVVTFFTVHLWEGRPWSLIKRQPWRFLFVLVGSSILGLLMFKAELFIMDYMWEAAYIGGQNEANFGWRFSQTTTMANFILVPAIMLNFFFKSAFGRMGIFLKGTIMTVIALFAGLLFAWGYYAFAPALLGVNPGVSHPSEFPAVFLLLIINLLVIQDSFFDGWPGYKLVKN